MKNGFDVALSRLIAGVENLNNKASSISDAASINESTNSQDLLLDLLERMSPDLPAPISIMVKAKRALRSNDYEKARRLALRAKQLDNDPKDASYDFLIAQAFYRQKLYKEAIGAFNNVLAIDPKHGATLNNIGSTYFALSQTVSDENEKQSLLTKSLEATIASYEIDQSSASVVVNISVVLNSLGKMDESIGYLDGWKGEPSASIFRQLAATYALKNDLSASISNLSQSFKLDQSSALRVAADSDFESLRVLPGFTNLLEGQLGSGSMKTIKAAWTRQAQQMHSADSKR